MNYTSKEIMVLAAARQIKNHDIVFCGTGISMLAAVAAKHIYAPDCVIFFETGAIDSKLEKLPLAVSDSRVMYGAQAFCTLVESFSFMQNKKTGANIVGIIGAAQIDPFGNLNSTMIGDYGNTQTRFPGSGGACDVASFVNTNIIFMMLEKRKFVPTLPYVTSPGWIKGFDTRKKMGLNPQGPSAVITDMGIMGFESHSKRMFLKEYYPGIHPETIKEHISFDIDISTARETLCPKAEELKILREKTDPEKLILN
ncbi:MAG: ketoacid-CoA transferase [Proteobacteria bacterium]|nr:ketoacid-CoA transferase [Pseudomonadota bacterium]MBU1581878.1 ketoacid-CoA transferase [Pseudomonadota bacterium]MBU2629022.1 ketoacid-CoA transferase [Pseudomonadota bacterium]